MKISSIITMVILSFFIASCGEQMNKGQSGALMGAGGGALVGQAIGHNTEATLIGALVGTFIGYMVGNEMDKFDRQQLNHVYERGVSGQTSTWTNPDTNNVYSVTPQPAVTGPSGPCRDAQITAIIDGKQQTTHTTACRDDNGQWVLQ